MNVLDWLEGGLVLETPGWGPFLTSLSDMWLGLEAP
jgi:hypothetical protein